MDTQVAFVSNKNSLKAFEKSVNVKLTQLEEAGYVIHKEGIRAFPNPIPEQGGIKLLWIAIIPYTCDLNAVRADIENNLNGFANSIPKAMVFNEEPE